MVIDKIGLLHIVDQRVLVARSYGKSVWYIPGGKRDAGESDLDTLTREVREELGTEVKIDTAVRYGEFHAAADGKANGTTVRVTCYRAGLRQTPFPSAEIEELAWFGVTDHARCSIVTQMILEDLHASKLIT